MEDNFILSNKILESYQQGDYDFIEVKDVKEFIKQLKEEFKGYGDYEEDIIYFIDKCAGKDLI